MTTSCLNSSQRLPTNVYQESKESFLFNLYAKKKVNPKLKMLMKSVKSHFGVVTCIGSDSFYVFTRQMLLHLDFNKALNLHEQNPDEVGGYRSEQFNVEHLDIEVPGKKITRKQSIEDELDTSFARANSQDIKNILHADVNEIESEYEFSQNQLVEKQADPQHFKKLNSSLMADKPISHKEQKVSTKNYIQKNQETQSQTGKTTKLVEKNKLSVFGQDSFHRDLKLMSRPPVDQKKHHDSMKQKGMRRVSRNGQEKYVQRNDFLRFYSCKEIGTDKEKRPIQWFYCELKDSNLQSIQSAYLLSSTIVFDLPFENQPTKSQFEREIRDYFQFYRRIESEINRYDDFNSDMPEVVIICPIEDSQKMENSKALFTSVFNQVEAFYISESKKNSSSSQSPFNQFQKNSPSKSKLPPTPKRMMPMTHKLPQVLGVLKRKVRLQFRVISEELQRSGVLRENYSRMREITSQGRFIFNDQSIKTMCGNWVTSQCYINLLQKLSGLLPYVDMETFYEDWESVFEEFIKTTMDEAAGKYEEKVNELIVGKSLISQSRLMEAHEVAKKETLRQISQKKIGSSRVFVELNGSRTKIPSISNICHNPKISSSRKLAQSRRDLDSVQNDGQMQEEELVNLVQSRIQEQKQELSRKAKEESIKWSKKFLYTEYEQIKKKLVSNEIKSIPNFKQQLEFLKDIYKKKLENYSALEYEMIDEYCQFLMENVFTGLDLLLAKQRQQWKQKLRKQGKKTQEYENQMKEMRKSLTQKQRSLAEEKVELQNKLQEIQASLTNLTHEIQVKNSEITYLKTEHDERLTEQQHQFTIKINSFKNDIEELQKDVSTKTNDLIYLQSQLEKEQLLHQQTHSNYQQILQTYKSNILQLQKKIKELSIINLNNEEKIKSSFKKQEMDQELSKVISQYQLKFQEIQKILEKKQKQIQDQKNKHQENIESFQDEVKRMERKNSQLILQQKILQEKLLQMESRLPRYKSYEIQWQKSQQDKQELLQKLQLMSNEKDLLEQKLNLDREEYEKTKIKLIQVFKNQAKTLHEEIEQLKTTNQTYHQKLYENKEQAEAQTAFTVKQDQVIIIKTKCKNCKQNQSRLTQALKIVDTLNESYKKMKQTYLDNQCIHCIGNKRQR